MTWARGSTRAWRTLRARVLREEPTCHLGYDGCTLTSTTVDHILSLAEGGTDHRTNLAGACQACHRAKSQAEAARGKRRHTATRQPEPHPGERAGGSGGRPPQPKSGHRTV